MREIVILVIVGILTVLFIIFFVIPFLGLIWMYRPELSLLDIIKMAIHDFLEWLF